MSISWQSNQAPTSYICRLRVSVLQGLLSENDRLAAHNRSHFDSHGVLALNLMSSPGSGKTRLLERTAGDDGLAPIRSGTIEYYAAAVDAGLTDGLTACVEEAVRAGQHLLRSAAAWIAARWSTRSTAKVWRVDIPGKKETVFGVALKGKDSEDCSSDEFIMSRIDKASPRSTAHLPYEILVTEEGEIEALYARFRIAINWPHLPMVASETGATFFSIMCSPGTIEEALIEAAGGEV